MPASAVGASGPAEPDDAAQQPNGQQDPLHMAIDDLVNPVQDSNNLAPNQDLELAQGFVDHSVSSMSQTTR